MVQFLHFHVNITENYVTEAGPIIWSLFSCHACIIIHRWFSWWDTGLHCFIMRNLPFSLLNVCSELCSLCSDNLLQQSVVFVLYILPCKSSCTSNIITKTKYEGHKPSKIRYKPWLVFLRPPQPLSFTMPP